MTIKRIEDIGSIEEDGEVFDSTGKSLGLAHLSATLHRRVHNAGTSQNPDAEVKSPVTRRRGRIQFADGGAVQLTNAVVSNAELTIWLDNGGQVKFRVVSNTTGEIQITVMSE